MSPISPAWPWGQRAASDSAFPRTRGAQGQVRVRDPSSCTTVTSSHLISLVAGVSLEARQTHRTLQEAKRVSHILDCAQLRSPVPRARSS